MKTVEYDSLVKALDDSVKRNLTDGLLLSGGLDTTLVTYLAARYTRPVCVTVALQGAPAPDVEFATFVARDLGLRHYVHYFDHIEMDEGIRAAIRILKCFDPMEIRNSATIYVALTLAKQLGLKGVMTGDGGDELFAGYSFLFNWSKEQLDTALQKMWASMSFSSIPLAQDLGLAAKLPILDPQFKDSAMRVDSSLKVGEEQGQVWGKLVLRKAFKGVVPDKILWRVKQPIEIGSGSTTMPQRFEARIPDSEFAEKKQKYLIEDSITIRDKEHLYYYEIYRDMYGCPRGSGMGDKQCPDCGVKVAKERNFCKMCGAYPI